MKYSVAVRNARQDAIETSIGASAKLQLFSGALPANCAAADSGTMLCQMDLPSDWLAAASGGAKAKSGTWSGTGATAAGAGTNVRHFRIKDSGLSACGIQGLCGKAWQASTAYVVGQQVINDSGKCYVCTTAGTSAGSGGPTGTGSGISDNTAVWDYAGPGTMTLDALSIANGQAVSVSSFQMTDGNA